MECGPAIGRRIRGGRCQSWRPSSRRIGRAMRAVLCLWALPGLAGVHWDRAMPFQGPANPAWALTITGSFSASTTYQCQFAPLATEGNPILTSAFSPEAGAASLVCTTPEWTYAAQRTRLSVLDVTTATPIAGPGGTAEVITYTASWNSRSVVGGHALGGDPMTIDGYGFDTASSDYVCKFVSEADATRVAQSVVPAKPTSPNGLRCTTPRWSFDASGGVGVTRIFVEKGGITIPYTGSSQDQIFTFTDVWTTISVSTGLSTYASETIVVSGAGFEAGSTEYSCQFETTSPVYNLGVAGTVTSSTAIECISPHWRVKEALTQVRVYKQNCNGARGVTGGCSLANTVENLDVFKEFTFIQAARNLSMNSALASRDGASTITVYGGGFDDARQNYAVEWRFYGDAVRLNVNGTRTAYSLEVELPQWAFAPNQLVNVTVYAGDIPLANAFDAAMTFEWQSSWNTFIDEAPTNAGTSAGGEHVTIIGQGFAVNASLSSATYLSGVGIDNDYACKFTDDKGFFLLSDRVEPVSRTEIVCITPAWGLVQVAVKTAVTLLKGSYEYPSQSAVFVFLSSWQTLSATSGPVGGGKSLTISGVGFNASKTFQCKFSYNNGELLAYTDPVLPVSANQVVFTTPRWPSWREGKTQLVIYEGGAEVLQIVDGGGGLATYEFLPGFILSRSHLDLKQGEQGHFRFFPDTIPTGPVVVRPFSNDSTVVAVSAPYSIQAAAGREGNAKDVSVQCLGPGFASVALASTGANFGHTYLDQVSVICRARIEIDRNSASMTRGSTTVLHVNLEPSSFSGNVSVSVTSSHVTVATVEPSMLVLGNFSTRVVELRCMGVGRAHILFSVVSSGGNVLFAGVETSFPVYGMPGYTFPISEIDVLPGESLDITFGPDTPPSLKTDFMVRVGNPAIVDVDQTVFFPAMRTDSKKFTVTYLQPGSTTIDVIGRSPGLLQQVSVGCSAPEAIQCTEKFVQFGCDFQGSNLTGGDSNWDAKMGNISASAGVADCGVYRGCFRASCCDSTLGKKCSSALKNLDCDLLKIVPPLSTKEDKSYDFGAEPADPEKADTLYMTWVSGEDCQPYVPCAWSLCFPGTGNFESVTSQTITVRTLPGFTISPSPVNLHQGRILDLTVALQAAPSGPVRVSIHLVDDYRNHVLDPTVHVTPMELVFSSTQMNSTMHVQWLRPGRTSFLLVADGLSNEYANVSHFFRDLVSCSPGFSFKQLDLTSDKGEFKTRNGAPNVYIKKDQTFAITAQPSFEHVRVVDVALQVLADGALDLAVSPASLRYEVHNDATLGLTIRSANVGESVIRLQNAGAPFGAPSVLVLDSGVGYTSGSFSIAGYEGSGFVGSYHVAVVDWGFYFDPVLAKVRAGANYSLSGVSTFSIDHTSPFPVAIGHCFRAAEAQLHSDDAQTIVAHSGVVVRGCSPQINASISAGKIVDLVFDSTSCLATGITCQLSLDAYSGAGFHGYFKTGIRDAIPTSTGTGYACDWACFATLSSDSGLVPVNGHGLLSHAQTCPVANPDCTDGYLASAMLAYGDVRDVSVDLRVIAFAAANITTDVSVLRQTQTATITVLPLEIPTGNVSFTVSASTDLLQLTNFNFQAGAASIFDAARTFTVTHMGGGSLTAKISIFGSGTGNFDGFTGSIEIDLLPGFRISHDSIKVQLFPGYFVLQFGPDSPPNKDTEVMVHVTSDFGKDILLDSYGEQLLSVPASLTMPAHSTQQQDLKIVHGGVGLVKMRNRVSGTASITFSVSDPLSTYDGIGIDGPTKTIFVDVKPGFESNIQDTYMRYLQADTLFPLTISLDAATTQAINISATSSNKSIAKVTPQVTLLAGEVGPVYFNVEHQGILGEAYISLNVDTPGGNYDSVTGFEYMRVLAVPGIIVSTKFLHLQYVKRVEIIQIGLDTRPDADVDISIASSDPHIVGVTSSVSFKMLDWSPSQRKTINVMWHGVGDAYLQCVCKSPGGNYNQVYRTDLVKVRSYRPLQVSRTKVRVQKYGTGEFSVSTAQKPQKDTLFTVLSSPPGIVDVSGPYLLSPGTNDTFVVNMTYLHMGSATVRVLASAPGDIYDGAAADIQVSAMPGFIFSDREILLYSCPRTSKCVKSLVFSPEIVPSADVTVTVTSSDDSIASISPSVVKLLAANGTGPSEPITVTYVSSGLVCLSFAATSVGNYDLVSSGGVTAIALPDITLQNFVITPANGGESHGVSDFDSSDPVIYVQKRSFSTFDIRPTVVPKGDSVIHIINPRPDLMDVTPSVVFKDGETVPKTVTITHKAVGNARLSLLGKGGLYDRAGWEDGILAKALPALEMSTERTNIRYRYPFAFLVQPSEPLTTLSGAPASVRLDVSVEFEGSLALNTPSVILDSGGNQTIKVTHTAIFVDPARPFDGATKLSIRAYGPGTNYHHVEAVVDVYLEYPGFGISSSVIHVQRWKDSTLTGTEPGIGRVFLTPDESPDSTTTLRFQSTSSFQSQCTASGQPPYNFCPVESQEYVEAFTKDIAQRDVLVWYFSDGKATKYIQATHEGSVILNKIEQMAAVAEQWPNGAKVAVGDDGTTRECNGPPVADECPGYFQAVYSGIPNYVPEISIINHAGFEAPRTEIFVQRQSEGEFTMKLDTVPITDTTVYFTSSDPSIVSVQESAYFFQGEDFSKNITVFAVSPGIAYISFRSESSGFDYDSAEAVNAIKINSMRGIGLSRLLIHLQAPPTESGKTIFTVLPDTDLIQPLTVSITSSNTAQVTCTPSVTFSTGQNVPQNVTLTHISSGTEDDPVSLSFTITTTDPEYARVRILPSKVIPLATFILSHSNIRVQKARTSTLTIAPNIAPDDDVEIFINVGDTSVVTATASVRFSAKKLDAVPFTLYHVGPGHTKLSFNSVSPSGNYYGSYLTDAIDVEALHGFQGWTRVIGVTDAVPALPITDQRLVVQSQPTSHLSLAHFLVTTDIIPDRETTVVVKSSHDNIIKTSSNVTFRAGIKEFKAVTVEHGGTAGISNIYFSASTAVAGGNYDGLESGNVLVQAMPGFVFSSTVVNVQKDQITNITIRPDKEPTAQVVLSLVTSDPSVINVTETIVFSVAGGVSSRNTKIISVGYEGLGTAALSFFAKGGNFEGVIYSNAVVAASRPGFIISAPSVVIPYDGSITITFQPDAVPTDDSIVTVTSSQPAKAAPMVSTFVLKAGSQDIYELTIKSYCSVSPGNCARAGDAVMSFMASSLAGMGNYDGVELSTAVVATVSAPELTVSTMRVFVQAEPGFSIFTVAPTVPLNKDTTVSFESLDAEICSVTSTVEFLQDASIEHNTRQVVVSHLSVGETYVKVLIRHPLDSNYVNIDPVLVYVRTLAKLTLTPNLVTLQPLTSVAIRVVPSIEIDSDLSIVVASTDSSIMTVSPPTLNFSPPRQLIGSGVNVAVGIRVVLSERFQVYPRLGVGVIVKILNDNLDMVSVDWENGPYGQSYAVGNQGQFTLALYEDLTQTVRIKHVHYGDASLVFTGHSQDVNYNGLDLQDAVMVHATPSFVCSPSDMVLQYQRRASAAILPNVAPSDDISVQVRVVELAEDGSDTPRSSSDIVQVTPSSFEMYRVDRTGERNLRTLEFYCAKTGSVEIELRGTGGNFGDVIYHPIRLRCLPGLMVSPAETPVLASPIGNATVTVRPNAVPNERVTVVVTANKPNVVRHTLRLYFEAFLENQEQEISIQHAGSFFDDDCLLSLAAYGGNFDGVQVPDVVHARIARPDLIVPQRSVSVQPNTFTTLGVYLDTAPSAGTYITATCSDTSIVTIDGPLLVYGTAMQLFTITHVEPGQATISFSLSALMQGSTYANVTLPSSLSVQVTALGSGFIASASQVKLLPGAPQAITIGPDAVPDSRVELQIEVEPAGIISISPAVAYFEQGTPGQYSTLHITWLQAGDCVLNLRSMGGNFQSITRRAIVAIQALPTLPTQPLHVEASKLVDRNLGITFSPPTVGAILVTQFIVEISDTSTFAKILATSNLAAEERTVVMGPFKRDVCYYYRVAARNAAGRGADGLGPTCITVLDSPSAVRDVHVKTISEEAVLLEWLAPIDSGDGTPDGIPILRYDIVVRSEDAELSEQLSSPADRRSAVLRIVAGVPYTININSVTWLSSAQPHSASLQVAYAGSPLIYDVPLTFSFSATAVIAPAGASTSILITPFTPPYLDAVVHVSSSNDQSGSATPRLVFKKGSVAPQYVIISHKKKGVSLLTFSPEGGYFKGLETVVTVETLASTE